MTPFRPPFTPTTRRLTLLSVSLSIPAALFATRAAMSTTSPPPTPSPSTTHPTSSSTNNPQKTFPTRPYTPHHPTFPYTPRDFHRADESSDTTFYAQPRFVTHIDDHAIALLRVYYEDALPREGRVLDLCCSWVSHFPEELEGRAVASKQKDGGVNGEERLEVIGLGMNKKELEANPILKEVILQDLNVEPRIPEALGALDACVCVVSVDYLTRPLEVLAGLRERMRVGGRVHLVVSNRCFPSKVVGRWLRVGEEERLQMVGDYLWFSGWRGVEIVELCDGRGRGEGVLGWLGGGVDPLWVVRGVKEEEGGEGNGVERSEL